MKAISFLFNSKGAGDITITIHNELNESIGTANLSNANIKVRNNWVKVIFSTPLVLTPGLTYHIHAVSNTASAVLITSSTASDFETTYFKTYFSVLNNDEEFHTMKVFGNLLCVGNGNKLLTVDDSEVLDPEAITFPEGERIRCLEVIGDYLAISTWKGTFKDGISRIYFWDAVKPTYHAFVQFDGVVNAMRNDGNNMLYVLHGTQGILSVYTGAVTKIRKLKNMDSGVSTFFYPEAINTLEGILYFGNYGASTNNLDTLIYSWGRSSKDYPMSFNKDFIISTGLKDTTVAVGALHGIAADKFLISWMSNGTYGVDIVDVSNAATPISMYTLRIDGGDSAREKHFKDISLRFVPITAAQKIEVYMRKNNAGSYNLIGTIDGSVTADLGLHYRAINIDKYAFELEFQIKLTTSSSVAPGIYQYAIDYEKKEQFKINDQSD